MQDVIVLNEFTENSIEVLTPFMAKTKEVTSVTEVDAPFLMKELVEGVLLAGTLLAKVSFQVSMAKADRKRAEAVAMLEKFPAFVEAGKRKGTVAEAEAFIALQPEVVEAQKNEAYVSALYEYLLSMKQALVYAHDDCKKAVYTRSELNMNKQVMLGG